MLETCIMLQIKGLFTTTYQFQTNGQCEQFNKTLLEAVRKQVGDDSTDWDLHTSAITFAYNTQCHETTGVLPFDLVLLRSLQPFQLESPSDIGSNTCRSAEEKWLKRLEILSKKVSKESEKLRIYKRTFDKFVRPSRKQKMGQSPTRKGRAK